MLSVQRFGRYALRPSSGISCRTWEPSRTREPFRTREPSFRTREPSYRNREQSWNFEPNPLFSPRGYPVLIQLTIAGGKALSYVNYYSINSQVRQEIPEEDQRAYRLKGCTDSNEDEDNSPNNLNNTNYQASSQKFQETFFYFSPMG